MKELSNEDKVKRYNEALQRTRRWYDSNTNEGYRGIFEDIFPELKESKDEKIKKVIYGWIYTQPSQFFDSGFSKEEMLAWLEKQGEQINLPQFTFDDVLALQCAMENVKKVQEDKDLYEKLKDLHGRVYDAYHFEKQSKQKPVIEMKTPEESLGIDSDTYNKIVDECVYELVGQKPAWSEEDEKNINELIRLMEQLRSKYVSESHCYPSWGKLVNWVKSLKERYAWKPSDDQIEALESATENCAYSEYQDCLRELIEQLKKLRVK